MTKHYTNEIGTELILDTGILIGSVTSSYIKYKNPAGIEGTFTAELFSSYSQIADLTGTYLLKYTLVSGDIVVPGEWKFQASIGTSTGTWFGETAVINIFDAYQ